MARVFSISQHGTPKRDVDLFGATTVRIDARRDPDSAGVPMLYLSAYVTDPDAFAARVVAALEWVQDGKAAPVSDAPVSTARAGEAENNPSPEAVAPAVSYSMPDFVEDVDWAEHLALADPVDATDWKSWSAAIERRIRLAVTGEQLAAMETANQIGFRMCPPRYRVGIGRQLHSAFVETAGQDMAA